MGGPGKLCAGGEAVFLLKAEQCFACASCADSSLGDFCTRYFDYDAKNGQKEGHYYEDKEHYYEGVDGYVAGEHVLVDGENVQLNGWCASAQTHAPKLSLSLPLSLGRACRVSDHAFAAFDFPILISWDISST